jgi:hypothetical protein
VQTGLFISHVTTIIMASQKGIIKLNGSIGDITFYKTVDGYQAREKGGVDGKRIATDPSFQRTRENGAEFGRAGKAGKLLRVAFRSASVHTSDSRMTSRLTQLMVKVLQSDLASARGNRNVTDGNTQLLQGFEFNIHSKLDTSFLAPYTATIVRATGVTTIEIEAYIAETMVLAPAGATHYKLLSACAAIDFNNDTYAIDIANSQELSINSMATAPLILTTQAPVASSHPLFLALGIDFYQEVNNVMYPLKNGAFNALAIVKADKA